jgi:hypothetical protein
VNVTTVPWGENERMSIHGKFFHKCFPSLIDFFSIFHRFIFIYFILFFVILFCFIQGKRQNVISHLYTLIHIIGYKLFCCECWLCPLLVLSTLSVFICRGPVEWPYIFTKKIQKNEINWCGTPTKLIVPNVSQTCTNYYFHEDIVRE